MSQAPTSRGLRTLWAAVTLPATAAHELTHLVVSAPWADTVALVIEPRSARVAAQAEWRDDVGPWGPRLAALAPFIAGSVAGLLAIAFLLLGGAEAPSSTSELAQAAILATWWVIYVAPSRADIEVARGGSDD